MRHLSLVLSEILLANCSNSYNYFIFYQQKCKTKNVNIKIPANSFLIVSGQSPLGESRPPSKPKPRPAPPPALSSKTVTTKPLSFCDNSFSSLSRRTFDSTARYTIILLAFQIIYYVTFTAKVGKLVRQSY